MSAVSTHVSPAKSVKSLGSEKEQRLFLNSIAWEEYEGIGKILKDRPGLRLTFDQGMLELMTTSPEHEKYKMWLGRFIETLAEEFNFAIEPGGNMTLRREDLDRGLESDQCYWIAHEKQVRGKLTWDPACDPPPDLVLEIEISREGQDRMTIYAALQVPEVWRFDGELLRVFVLQPDRNYHHVENSPTFPGVPLVEMIRFLEAFKTQDYLSVVRSFQGWVRGLIGRKV
ncbi:MAG TPA: Uma2 family endonuclease [Gemmataceae bacterium]|jgi:Uma2 family endonuclease|nr:Uma2 family endonuclease [Gemmataceae bacterium]